MKRYLLRLFLPLVLLAALVTHISGILSIPYVNQLDRLLYDTRLRLSAQGGQDPRIVIVAIDEASLNTEGHWPWTRDKLSRLIEQLFDYGVAVVGFDMVFAERDESADLRLLRGLATDKDDGAFITRLNELGPYLDRDRMFADALTLGPTVLGYYFDTNRETAFNTGELPYPAFDVNPDMAAAMRLPVAHGYGANLPELAASAYSAGFINNPLIDEDGVVRRAPLLHKYELAVYESLSLALGATYLSDVSLPIFVQEMDMLDDYPPLEAMELAGERIPIDAQGAVLVPYRGPVGSFPYVSATRIINDTLINKDVLQGTIALVAATAPGLLDIRSTPFGSVYPGAEIHANVIAGILDGKFRWQPAYTVVLELLSVLIFGLMSVLILPLLSPIRATIQTLLIFGTVILLNYYMWNVQMHVLPMATTLIAISGIYVLNMFFGYFFETRSQFQMSELFGQYVPPDLVKEMSRDPQNYSLASQRREMTVLFSDIRDFTSISEHLNPAQLSQMLNEYLTPMTEIIQKYNGTIDKYIGDALMAFWGAPLEDPDHASHALHAAQGMLDEIHNLNRDFAKKDWPIIKIGVGINSGEMSVGNMGSHFRRAYTVLGDSVNLGSRLEGLTKLYGVDMLVGESTAEQALDYDFLEIDRVRVKGKEEPVSMYQPLGLKGSLGAEQKKYAQLFRQVLADYRAREFDMAEEALVKMIEENPGIKLLDIYLERVRVFKIKPPPPDWDFVFTHVTK
jgi:adenylate cyclase